MALLLKICYKTVLYAKKPTLLKVFQRKIKSQITLCKNEIYKYILNIQKKYLLRHKKVIVYGAGKNFEQIYKQNGFANVNVIAVSNVKFTEIGFFKDYKSIPPYEIEKLNPDIIYVTLADTTTAKNYLQKILNNKIKFIYYENDYLP